MAGPPIPLSGRPQAPSWHPSAGRANPYNYFVRSRAAQGIPWARALLHPSGYTPSSGATMRHAGTLPGMNGSGPRMIGPGQQGAFQGVRQQASQQPPSPLDATYYSNVANNLFQTTNRVNALNQQSGYANTDLQNALSRIAYQQPRDQLRLQEGANRSGGLYSTGYGQQQSNIGVNYANQQSALNQNFARGQAGRQEEISGLLGGLPLYAAGQYAAAADRAATAAANDPSIGMPGSPGGMNGSGPRPIGPGQQAGLPHPARVGGNPNRYDLFVRSRARQGIPWARQLLHSNYGR